MAGKTDKKAAAAKVKPTNDITVKEKNSNENDVTSKLSSEINELESIEKQAESEHIIISDIVEQLERKIENVKNEIHIEEEELENLYGKSIRDHNYMDNEEIGQRIRLDEFQAEINEEKILLNSKLEHRNNQVYEEAKKKLRKLQLENAEASRIGNCTLENFNAKVKNDYKSYLELCDAHEKRFKKENKKYMKNIKEEYDLKLRIEIHANDERYKERYDSLFTHMALNIDQARQCYLDIVDNNFSILDLLENKLDSLKKRQCDVSTTLKAHQEQYEILSKENDEKKMQLQELKYKVRFSNGQSKKIFFLTNKSNNLQNEITDIQSAIKTIERKLKISTNYADEISDDTYQDTINLKIYHTLAANEQVKATIHDAEQRIINIPTYSSIDQYSTAHKNREYIKKLQFQIHRIKKDRLDQYKLYKDKISQFNIDPADIDKLMLQRISTIYL